MVMYAHFVEDNEWEGETWHFYFPLEENEEAMWYMIERFDLDEGYLGNFYFDEDVPEEEVDVLVKHADDTGYMAQHNKCEGRLDVEMMKKLSDQALAEALYKGGVEKLLV